MKIDIDPELKLLHERQLDKIKEQFLEEAFSDCPEEANRFSFESIDERCLVYPNGEFKVCGFYHYMCKEFRIHVTFFGNEMPWVEVIHYHFVYTFRSMRDAISFCQNYRRRVTPGFARTASLAFETTDSIMEDIIKRQFEGLEPEDKRAVHVESYFVERLYSHYDYYCLNVHFSYQGIDIEMCCCFTLDNPTNLDRGVVEFNVKFRLKRQLSSLSETIDFIKSDPEYIGSLENHEDECGAKEETIYRYMDLPEDDLPF